MPKQIAQNELDVIINIVAKFPHGVPLSKIMEGLRTFDFDKLRVDLLKVFNIRNTHPLPLYLPLPPSEWSGPYVELAKECGIESNLEAAFQSVSKVYSRVIDQYRLPAGLAPL